MYRGNIVFCTSLASLFAKLAKKAGLHLKYAVMIFITTEPEKEGHIEGYIFCLRTIGSISVIFLVYGQEDLNN